MTKIRSLLFILTIAAVAGIGALIALFARGYRFDTNNLRFFPNGLLVVKSNPDGAQVFINGELETATNTTIRLPPGTYDVNIRKEGFFAWNKRLAIEQEVVTEVTAHLFKSVPSLSPITFSGSVNPTASADLSKIAYVLPPVAGDQLGQEDKAGLWVIETVDLPLGFSREPRRITDGNLDNATWAWSPNGREILLVTARGSFLLDANTFTPQQERINVALRQEEILAEWEKEKKTRLEAKTRKLPDEIKDILARKTSSILFSADEDMILYTASNSAEIPENLIKQLPGTSTQKQERHIKKGIIYIYDIKEDRNFLVDGSGQKLVLGGDASDGSIRRLSWFPTSRHLVLAEEGKITIMDYDGTNRQEVYSGSYVAPAAYPTLSSNRLLILTNLGADSALPNLYSLSLK